VLNKYSYSKSAPIQFNVCAINFASGTWSSSQY